MSHSCISVRDRLNIEMFVENRKFYLRASGYITRISSRAVVKKTGLHELPSALIAWRLVQPSPQNTSASVRKNYHGCCLLAMTVKSKWQTLWRKETRVGWANDIINEKGKSPHTNFRRTSAIRDIQLREDEYVLRELTNCPRSRCPDIPCDRFSQRF